MKTDLFFYGLIGFQPHWRNVQGYEGANLATEIVRNARSKGVEILAMTSMHDAPNGVPRGSVHDRFTQFRQELAKDNKYIQTELGPNAVKIDLRFKNGNNTPLYVLNAQKVVTSDEANGGLRADIAIVGANDFKNHYPTKELIEQAHNRGCIAIATSDVSPLVIESNARFLDAVAHTGHNLRFVGKNNSARRMAESVSIPVIAVSGAKLPENVASAYTETFTNVYEGLGVSLPSEAALLHMLGQDILNHDYRAHFGYEPTMDALRTHKLFLRDTRPGVREALGV